MKKTISILLIMLLMITFSTGCSAQPQTEAIEQDAVITLQVGNPMMAVNGEEQEIDPGRGSVPFVTNDRTLLPVRAVVEAMGGAVQWDEETQTAILAKGNTVLLLVIGSRTAYLNETTQTLDTAPIVQNDRTMLPIRFIAESFGYTVGWDGDTQTITLTPNAEPEEENTMPTTPTATTPPNEETRNSIVVYFSNTGNTEAVAQKIADVTGADIYEIIPEIPYTSDDTNYNNNSSRANREQNDDSARPAIAGEKIDLSGYDTVYLGYPIWWGTIPRIIQTFMDTYDLSDKTIMPFATSGGSGISSSVTAIRQYCPQADVKNGLLGSRQTGEQEISKWLTDNGIEVK